MVLLSIDNSPMAASGSITWDRLWVKLKIRFEIENVIPYIDNCYQLPPDPPPPKSPPPKLKPPSPELPLPNPPPKNGPPNPPD